MAAEENLVDLMSQIKKIPQDPESYFQPAKELPKDTLSSLKRLFDFSRGQERSSGNSLCPLKQLIVEGFDDEQIWQQIELQNEPVISDTKKKIKDIRKMGLKLRLVASGIKNGRHDGDDDDDENDDGHLGVEFEDSAEEDDAIDIDKIGNRVMMPASSSEDDEEDDDDEIDDSDKMDDDDDEENDVDDEENDEEYDSDDQQRSTKQEKKNKRGQKKGKSGGSVVDDKFFKLAEMTEFLDKMDQDFERKRDRKQDDDDDDNEIDYFMDIESNEDEDEETDDEDDEEWGNILGTTAKMMGR